MFNKKYIKLNIFLYAILILIIKKFNNDLRICIDYRVFNKLIIKNRNALFLIRKTLIKFYIFKIYNKFNIIIIFNEIKMKKNNEKKIAFFIKYDLFEYVIIFFELYNVLIIFQIFINKMFKKYFNNFYFAYLNNILIYNDNKKKYI